MRGCGRRPKDPRVPSLQSRRARELAYLQRVAYRDSSHPEADSKIQRGTVSPNSHARGARSPSSMPKSETTFPIQILRPPDEQSGPVRHARRHSAGNVKSVFLLDTLRLTLVLPRPRTVRVCAPARRGGRGGYFAAPRLRRAVWAALPCVLCRHVSSSLRYTPNAQATTPTACRVIYN